MIVNKYTLEQFKEKYEGRYHISCGINYVDGTKETMINSSFYQIMGQIKDKESCFYSIKIIKNLLTFYKKYLILLV